MSRKSIDKKSPKKSFAKIAKKVNKKVEEEPEFEGLRLIITSLAKEALEIRVKFVEDNEERTELLEQVLDIQPSEEKNIEAGYSSLNNCCNLMVVIMAKAKESQDEPKKRKQLL